ncbi:MAG: NADH-quinone oxidoreductase subunit M [Clostridiales bacterium]|nr:NADH-quinone oxidoreductase subunit M [Clostridiales bacterium]
MLAVDLLVLLPLAGAIAVVVIGARAPRFARVISLCVSFGPALLLASLAPHWLLDGTAVVGTAIPTDAFSFWSLRIDGMSAPLLALGALLGPVAVLASWNVEKRAVAHHALLLGLQAAIAGVFLAADIVLLYVFWEAVLIPMYFLIGVWGHEGRKHAAMKFFIYTFAGSALMLVGILVAIFQTGQTSIEAIVGSAGSISDPALVFWLIAAGMLVKIPAVPLHTWLADAHVEAPTAGSILLAGLLLKMGGYGFMRVAIPIAPDVFIDARGALAILGGIGIVYGASLAFAQIDLKRLIALSSVSHMGFVLLAISSGTENGYLAAMLVMVSHGLIAPLLFLLAGQLYERTGTRSMERFGGLGVTMPRWAALFTFGALASLGLPGLSGFPGELLALVSAFGAWSYWMAPAAAGVVLAAAYNLRAVRETVWGQASGEWSGIADVGVRDLAGTLLLGVAIVAVGVWPGVVTGATGDVFRVLASMTAGG